MLSGWNDLVWERLMKEKQDIFISYRRNGGEWFAYCVYLELVSAGYSVFFDMASLRSGSFADDIEDAVRGCRDFVLILPPGALDRCAEEKDLVYTEIRTARESGKNLIPLMMKGFELPPRKLFDESHVPERYELMEYVAGQNGHTTNGIVDLEGTLLRLKKLLTAVPRLSGKPEKAVGLTRLFPEDEETPVKIRPEHEILSSLSTNEFFVEGSRDREIAWLSDAIERMQPVFVWGYGGVGKTELAVAFARCHARRRNVAFVTFSGSMRETVIHMKFLGYEMPDLDRLSREEREAAEEKIYREKLRLLNGYGESDILIIDNFDAAGKTLAELRNESAYRDIIGLNMHVVFTTRSRPDQSTKELQPLAKDDLLTLMKHYLGDISVSDEMLGQLIDVVDSHTMAVELMAKLIADEFSDITPEKILEAFAGEKVKELDGPEIDSYKDRVYTERTIFDHIRLLFDLSVLSETEKTVLRHGFFIPTGGMKTDVFLRTGREHWEFQAVGSELPPYDKVVKGLAAKGWLRLRNGSIFLHPLVREVMWEEGLIRLDGELMLYLENFHGPQHNPAINIGRNGLTLEDWKNAERMRAEYMAGAYRHFPEEPFFAAAAACLFRNCMDFDQCVIYSHDALDTILSEGETSEEIRYRYFTAIQILHEMWCPNMVESAWDPDCYYGNELQEDHDDQPEDIQGIYYKIQLIHGIRPVDRKKRYVEISGDGRVLKRFNDFDAREYAVPDGVTEIEGQAFEKCIHLKRVAMPDSVERLGKDVFLDCRKLTRVKLSENIKELPYGVFCGCEKLKEINIPKQTEVIGEDAFLACRSLKIVRLPDSLRTIGISAFQGCGSLARLDLPEGLEELGTEAFRGCGKLRKIILPEGLKALEADTFCECESLEEIRLPDSLEEIGEGAFGSCKRLQTVHLPRNLKNISPAAFRDSAVREITVEKDNPWYCAAWGSLFTKDRKKLVCCPPANPVFRVFEETEEIGESACQGNPGLTELEISVNIRSLSRNAFRGCRSLRKIIWKEGVRRIGDSCFRWCERLEGAVLPDSVTEIGEGAFGDCYRLEAAELPARLEQIGAGVFERCFSLKTLTLPEKIRTVPRELCAECYGLEEVTLAEGTEEIRFNAFADCVHLKKVRNTEHVILAEGTVFQNCVRLDMPRMDSRCQNGRYLGTDFETLCENSGQLMLGYEKNHAGEWKQKELEMLEERAGRMLRALEKRRGENS